MKIIISLIKSYFMVVTLLISTSKFAWIVKHWIAVGLPTQAFFFTTNAELRKTGIFCQLWKFLKVNESWYIALFVASGSICKPFPIEYVNIYLFLIFFPNIFFNRFFPLEKCRVTPHCLNHDLFTSRRNQRTT